MARIIGEVGPRFVFVENSPLLISRGLDTVLCDLAALGFDAEWGVVGAHHAGAPHKRDRIWILAYAIGEQLRDEPRRGGWESREDSSVVGNDGTERTVAYADEIGRDGRPGEQRTGRRGESEDGGQVADSKGNRRIEGRPEPTGEQGRLDAPGGGAWWAIDPAEIPDATSEAPMWRDRELRADPSSGYTGEREEGDGIRWPVESGVGRVAHGVAHRVERLKAIGNGQVPAVAALAWETLMERIER
jgi:DNA (cytosine-5)-methyltransferase 1